MAGLPKVLVTEVVRSTEQGDSHGGVHLVDLETGGHERVLDWNTMDIDWEGRGADRGLRGIAFHGETVLIAASDAVLVFDPSFNRIGAHEHPLLAHCHEIWLEGTTLYLTSTGYDSVLELDVESGRFTAGTWLDAEVDARQNVAIRSRAFDPGSAVGTDAAPLLRDRLHINMVSRWQGVTLVGCLRYPTILGLKDGGLGPFAPVRGGTHNAQAFGDGVIYNATAQDATIIADRRGLERAVMRVPRYDEADLLRADVPKDHARQAFARGLCWTDEFIVVGSSPSTVTAFRRGTWEEVASVNLTMDVRHCPHGLEVWPF
jgi:hypothetical protein